MVKCAILSGKDIDFLEQFILNFLIPENDVVKDGNKITLKTNVLQMQILKNHAKAQGIKVTPVVHA